MIFYCRLFIHLCLFLRHSSLCRVLWIVALRVFRVLSHRRPVHTNTHTLYGQSTTNVRESVVCASHMQCSIRQLCDMRTLHHRPKTNDTQVKMSTYKMRSFCANFICRLDTDTDRRERYNSRAHKRSSGAIQNDSLMEYEENSRWEKNWLFNDATTNDGRRSYHRCENLAAIQNAFRRHILRASMTQCQNGRQCPTNGQPRQNGTNIVNSLHWPNDTHYPVHTN